MAQRYPERERRRWRYGDENRYIEPRGYRLTLNQDEMSLENLGDNRWAERQSEDMAESEWESLLCIIGCGCE